MSTRLKRIYEDPSEDDGVRVLVDRLWPRGVSKEDAALDEWLKDIAPSDELRRWYDHDPSAFDVFREAYKEELEDGEQAEALQHLRELAEDDTVTLLTATSDVPNSHARVLAELV